MAYRRRRTMRRRPMRMRRRRISRRTSFGGRRAGFKM